MTRTTSPLDAMLLPSKVVSDPMPEVNAPPWIQNMTGFRDDFAGRTLEGTKGVQMFKKRQSSLVPVVPDCTQEAPNLVASIVEGPVYAFGYVQRGGAFAYGIPKNLKVFRSRKLNYCERQAIASEH